LDLLKWNRKVSIVKADPYLLDFKRLIKDPLINNTIIKVNIFIIKFFLKTKIVDFSNIKITIEQRVFNISPIILIQKINKLIRSFLNGKVLKLNGILNKVFKVVVLVIVKDLVKVTSYYFASGIILKIFKIFITVVLCKKGRKKYFFLSSYKLIIFKNTLIKVLEKYIANIMSKAAEEYRLFFFLELDRSKV